MITSFKADPYKFLSNFWYVNIWNDYDPNDDLLYLTVEHAYQSAKTLDYTQRKELAFIYKPGDVKKEARKRTLEDPLFLRDDWQQVNKKIMLQLLRCKFSYPDLAKRLIATGNTELIEGNYWHDNFWGACYCSDCKTIMGQNWLGKLLMHVRTELQL